MIPRITTFVFRHALMISTKGVHREDYKGLILQSVNIFSMEGHTRHCRL